MKIHSCLGLFVISLLLASYSLPAAAAIASSQIGSRAEQKIYKEDIGKSGPVGKQETIELTPSDDA